MIASQSACDFVALPRSVSILERSSCLSAFLASRGVWRTGASFAGFFLSGFLGTVFLGARFGFGFSTFGFAVLAGFNCLLAVGFRFAAFFGLSLLTARLVGIFFRAFMCFRLSSLSADRDHKSLNEPLHLITGSGIEERPVIPKLPSVIHVGC